MRLPIRVDARTDPRVADYRAVADPELVRRRGLFVAEGRLVVRRVIEDEQVSLRSVLLSEAALSSVEPLLARLGSEVVVYVSSVEAMSALAGYNVHRGCLALAERLPSRSVQDVLSGARVVVIAEGVGDPSNLGGIFRNALAFGAGAVLLNPASSDPLYRKAVRTSMAATLRVPFARLESWPDDLGVVRRAGFTLVAMTPREPGLTLEEFIGDQRAGNVALMVGAEGEGLTTGALSMADVRVRIPVRAEADSVNVAVAAGIALYRLTAHLA